MRRLQTALYALRYLGPRFVWLRLKLRAAKAFNRTGKVFRPRPWGSIELNEINRDDVPGELAEYAAWKQQNLPAFLFPYGQPPTWPGAAVTGGRSPDLQERIALLEADRCVYFFHTPSPEPIDWHRNPFEGFTSNAADTWSDIPDYLPDQGDPRVMWEPSRCAWAIDCARSAAHGPRENPVTLFGRWLDSWMTANEPFRGFQWKCGQESSVRFLAVALGFWATGTKDVAPERWRQFARLAWATGYRVEHHIDYAISQKNNHAVSEALGLMLIAHLFPEFRDAPRWRDIGRRVLARELRRQIYADGSYCQQSTNYQRVMMQGAMLALRLAEVEGDPFDRDLYDLLSRCTEFLWQITDPVTGRAPQYGNNDGAWILPLSEGDFWDFRPMLQAAAYLTRRQRLLPPGSWDEDMLWLFGPDSLDAEVAPSAQQSSRFDAGGYYTLRRGDAWAMQRCCRYKDRIGHLDQLSLDLWWRGQNVLRDCGTYLYYIPGRPAKEAYFSSQAAHNVVQVDNADPAERVSRFLRFPWPRARLLRHEGGDWPLMEAEFDGYDRRPWRVKWRRAVACLPDGCWLVVDDLLGSGEHDVAVQWHSGDWRFNASASDQSVSFTTPAGPVSLAMRSPSGPAKQFEVVRNRDVEGQEQGLAATHYATLESIPTVLGRWSGALPTRIVTCIGLGVSAELASADPYGRLWDIRANQSSLRVRLAQIGQAGNMLLEMTPAAATM